MNEGPKPEYYKILGLRYGSDIKQIKKAFKKFAIKFHPDRAPASKKKEYEAKYAEVSDAYSLLSDPEKKKMYDQHGHHGLEHMERQEQQKNQQQAWQERRDDQMSRNLFQGTGMMNLNVEQLGKFYRRIGVWVVFFYRGREKESQEIKQPFTAFHDKFSEIFTIAAVNCEEDEEICEEFAALDTPAITIFNHDITQEGERYTGQYSVGKFAGFAAQFLEDYVRVVTPANFEEFMASNPTKTKLLLNTSKKSTPPILKVLSKEFKGSLAVGIVKNQPQLAARFEGLPTPGFVSIGASPEDFEIYSGGFKKSEIANFVRHQIQNYTPDALQMAKKSKHIVGASQLPSGQCSMDYKHLCFLVFSNKEESSKIQGEMNTILQYFTEDPVVLNTIDRRLFDFEEVLASLPTAQRESTTLEGVYGVLVKPSKKRITFLISESGYGAEKLRNSVESALSGSVRYLRFKGNFDDFVREVDEIEGDL